MSRGFLKRIIPFAVALTLGLFIASFFVTVAAPRFNFKRSHSTRKYRETRAMERENQRLQEQISRQQMRIAELERKRTMDFESDFEPLPPPIPTAPRRVR